VYAEAGAAHPQWPFALVDELDAGAAHVDATEPRRWSTRPTDDRRSHEGLRILGDSSRERVDVRARDFEVRIHDDDDVGAELPGSMRAEVDTRAEAEVRVRGNEVPACLARAG
jgi:hypothetical protein